MIDALYPIMGGMISKYVTQAIKEMMEKINEKIEQGLSVERYKRKLKAKLTGVSETELLLEESGDADIHSIFIIHKETGLLIAEAHMENSEIDDPHMVASMASAIKDFVNDWISSHQETESKEVQLLSYGDATLYIESAGSVYMIAFLDSEPDYAQRSEINSFFAKLLQKYSTFFQSFNGDDSDPQIKKIETKLHTFLNEENHTHSNKQEKSGINPAKYILTAAALLLLGYVGYVAKIRYDLFHLEQTIYAKTGEKARLKEESDGLHLYAQPDSMEIFYKIEQFVRTHTNTPFINNMQIPARTLDSRITQLQSSLSELKTVKQDTNRLKKQLQAAETVLQESRSVLHKEIQRLAEEIQKLQNKMSTQNREYATVEKKLSKISSLASLQKYIIETLKKALPHKELLKSDGSLDFSHKDLFAPGSTVPNPQILSTLAQDYTAYIRILMGNQKIRPFIKALVIEGYTDSSGNAQKNLSLSSDRAGNMKKYFLSLPISKRFGLEKIMYTKGMGAHNPVMVNGKENKEASRRIKIRFLLNEKKLLKAIEESSQ